MCAFAEFPFSDAESAALSDAGYLGATGRYAPAMLGSVRGRVQGLPGTGHASPFTHPEAVSRACADFLTPAHPSR